MIRTLLQRFKNEEVDSGTEEPDSPLEPGSEDEMVAALDEEREQLLLPADRAQLPQAAELPAAIERVLGGDERRREVRRGISQEPLDELCK